MRHPVSLLLSALTLLSFCLPVTGQKFLPKSIQFQGQSEFSEQELLAAANLKKGVVLTAAEMNDHSKLLLDWGVFDGVSYKFDGQDLIYQITVSPQLFQVRFQNLPLASGTALDAKIHERMPLYHGKVPTEGNLLKGVIEFLEQELASEGVHAEVVATPSGAMGSRQVTGMTFSIASPPVVVGSVKMLGVSATMESKVTHLAERSVGQSFDTDNTAGNLEHEFASFYADEGYAAVTVKAVRSGDPVATAASVAIPFSVTVDEGHLYKVGAIHLPSDSLMTQAEMEKMRTPQPGSISQGASTRMIWYTISSRYKSKGYLDCAVTPHPEFDDAAGVVNYSVEINPGPVYHLGLLKFENVSDDMRKLLMRNWQMLPGDPFDEGYVANFLLLAQKADPVLQRSLSGVKSTFDVRADPQTHEVNCVIRLERLH
jgi:outer membrane protein assembly factor BamA